eukprot:TRINITY_DN100528_c0_g1_i1.p1 TRINITY_DN100528_c0_g1~~TRINITY_DN100528_c0_g1_i1.p1  ORF type:complete len:579 (+),score=137.78 TRINITY_DN100528_c0_g1_i1:72-1808(+)
MVQAVKKAKLDTGSDGPLFLGLDVSTQSCKALVIDANLNIVGDVIKVQYDADLPHYGTKDGCHRGEGGRVTSPTRMWIEALELALSRLKERGCPMERIVAVSGSGQQHGSIYWSSSGVKALASLAAEKGSALSQLGDDAFATLQSPIWMDTSTGDSCRAMGKLLGAPLQVAAQTGSSAQERFTAHHIRRFIAEHGLSSCAAVSLVSSFCASLLAGQVVPIDTSDAAGMNLMDIRSRLWSEDLLDFVAPGQAAQLREVLAEPQDSWSVSGRIHRFWVQRYGFPATSSVVAWSGDNPCAVIGNGLLSPGDVAISLGTSDTVMSIIPAVPKEPLPFGHLFPHPTLPGCYWSLLCYSNGDVTRRKVRDEFFPEDRAKDSWDKFSDAVRQTPPGNSGYAGLYFSTDEVTPAIKSGADLRAHTASPTAPPEILASFPEPAANARAVIEMRALAIRKHVSQLMPEIFDAASGASAPQLMVTGGASNNPAILQVFADVFQRPVRRMEDAESAAMGAAVRAMHAHFGGPSGKTEAGGDAAAGLAQKLLAKSSVKATPDPAADAAYKLTARSHAALEEAAWAQRGRAL